MEIQGCGVCRMNREKEVKGNCVIVGAGDLTVSELKYNQDQDFCIAVDGGIMYCEILDIEPDLLVGDFDSLDENWEDAVEAIEEQCPEKVVRLNPSKDDTDMLAALRIGLEKGYERFYIYGATGGRLEHTLANIQCLLFLKKSNAVGYIMDGTGMILVLENESVSFKDSMEGFLSIFSLGQVAEGVTLKGLKYPLDQYSMTNEYPIGISNEFIGEEAEISVEKGQLAVIISWE